MFEYPEFISGWIETLPLWLQPIILALPAAPMMMIAWYFIFKRPRDKNK